jgi:hypothetical protein
LAISRVGFFPNERKQPFAGKVASRHPIFFSAGLVGIGM